MRRGSEWRVFCRQPWLPKGGGGRCTWIFRSKASSRPWTSSEAGVPAKCYLCLGALGIGADLLSVRSERARLTWPSTGPRRDVRDATAATHSRDSRGREGRLRVALGSPELGEELRGCQLSEGGKKKLFDPRRRRTSEAQEKRTRGRPGRARRALRAPWLWRWPSISSRTAP